jgi:hypothetical protein
VARVIAPPARVPQHSLLRAALTGPQYDDEPDWARGLSYAPETCGGYRAISDCTAEEVDYGAGPGVAAFVDYRPWDLQVEDPCASTFGYAEQVVTDRLRRAADAIESFAIARELWTGDLTRAEVTANPDLETNLYLTKDPTVLGAGPVSPRRGLGMLEQAAGEAFHGQQIYLHISREARPFFPELVKVGQLIYTNLDNVVVADAGYPGTAPDGVAAVDNVAWIYATGPVVARRTPLVLDPAELAQAVDVRTNTIRRTAAKRVAATFDTCAYFAAPITLS